MNPGGEAPTMSKVWNAIRLALRNLALHKLRSTLTVLGLIFGVASVVAMLAIAEGASEEAQRQIAELGATNIIVTSQKPMEDLKATQNNSFVFAYGLTHLDLERIVGTIPTVKRATPLREFRQEARFLDRVVEARIVGSTPDGLAQTGRGLTAGRFLQEMDLARFANNCVLGADIAKDLFPIEDPIGRSVRIGEQQFFLIVGVASYKAPTAGTGSSLTGQDYNKDIYIPLTTDRARFGDTIYFRKQGSMTAEKIELSQITVATSSMDQVKQTSKAIESLLKQTHPKVDYGVTVPLDLLEKAEATKRIFNLVLGSIASISLIVGGIGIMNIMLATVTERTREIGIRRALGAKQRDITLQFLIETAVMSATGGLIGVVLGLAAPPLVSQLSGMPVVIRPWSPILAFVIAVAIGVLFGVYPAKRAAQMDPIEALRAE
jgi:putative ABC transport system permease protein